MAGVSRSYVGWFVAAASLLVTTGLTSVPADTPASASASATIVINNGGSRQGFTPKASTMSQDGSLTTVNLDVFNEAPEV